MATLARATVCGDTRAIGLGFVEVFFSGTLGRSTREETNRPLSVRRRRTARAGVVVDALEKFVDALVSA